jgi:hypothetical protein
VDDADGFAKNAPLRENLWATYVCVANDIPLGIVGMSGMSKSLAVNVVLSHLFM